jgi:MFS family permease
LPVNKYRELFRKREFALLWGGATVSALGDGMSFVALVWLIIERGGTPADVGLFAAVYTAPVVIGGIAAGVILDRFDPRRVIAADNVIRGIAIASVPIASLLGVLTTAQLFVVAAVYGLLFMTSAAGIPTLIPTVVGRDDLTTANALESISYGIAGLVGPTVAGLVIAVLGAPAVLAIDAVTYAIFVACLLAMRRPEPAPRSIEAAPNAGDKAPATLAAPAGGGIGPAVRFILGSPAILTITVMYMCLNLGGGISAVLLPIYARDVLEGGPTTYGLLLSALTAGELAGLLFVGAVTWRWPLGRSIAGAVLLGGFVASTLFLRPPLLPLLVILVAWGLTESSLTPWAQTIRMRLIPPEMRGRVFALLRTFMQSTRPIGAILGGLLLVGADITLAVLAIVLLEGVPGVVGLLIPALGREATADPREVG